MPQFADVIKVSPLDEVSRGQTQELRVADPRRHFAEQRQGAPPLRLVTEEPEELRRRLQNPENKAISSLRDIIPLTQLI